MGVRSGRDGRDTLCDGGSTVGTKEQRCVSKTLLYSLCEFLTIVVVVLIVVHVGVV